MINEKLIALFRIMKRPEKDMPYFDLLAALSSDDCALCSLIDKKVQFYLEHLLYESVNDFGFRKNWKKRYGSVFNTCLRITGLMKN